MNVLFPAYGYSRPRLDAPGLGVPVLGWAEGERQACTDWLDAELASLVAVTARAAAAGWPAYAWRLPATIFRHLQAGARNAEAALMLRHAVRAAHAAGDQAAEASALTNLGNIKWLWGQNKEAIEHCEEALALSRACGDREQQARALNNRAIIDIREGRYDQASRRLRASLTLFRELGDLLGQARVLITLGAIDACLGRPGSADVLLRESLAISRRAGDVVREAEALGEIGVLASKCRRYEQAERCQRQALAIFRDQGLMDGETDVLIGLGGTLLAAGRPEQAIVHLRRALRFASTSDYADMRARAAHRLGSAYLAMDDLGEARGLWEEALAIYTRLGTPSAQEVRDLLAAHPGDCGSQPITDADAARQPS
jgi:tetratricopeptide (TPR) repeat protein